jgi:type IV secretion system protein VirB9
MRHLLASTALLALLLPAPLLADGGEPSLPNDTRIRVLPYDESDVYTIVTKYGYQTNLVLGDREEVQTISMGDRSLWQIIPSGNRLFIRPMDDGLSTNMTLITNKRAYQFDLKSLAEGSDEKPLYVARFSYPDDMPRPSSAPALPVASAPAGFTAEAVAVPMPAAVETPLSPESPFAPSSVPGQGGAPNYNYTYSGPDALAPAKVFDDGNSTFLRYAPGSELPVVSVRDPNGAERAVSFYSKDGMLVVPEVAGEMVLRYTAGMVTLYNETLNPKK